METKFLECRYSEQEKPFDWHFHNTYELIYVCSGAARFSIGKACYDAGAGSVLFISKLEEHSVEMIETPYRRYFVQLTSSQLEQCAEEIELKSIFVSRPPGFSHCLSLGGRERDAEALLGELERESHAPEPFRDQRLAALFRLFMILCYRACKNQFPLSGEAVPDSVQRIQAYLDTNFSEPLKLEELARKFFISPSYLSHSFRKWIGCSPKQYLMLCRLSYAKRLLLTTDRSVAEISDFCGFQDTSNFIRSFKGETDTTPAEYRKRQRNRAPKYNSENYGKKGLEK